jgi:hypothetical protein
MLPRCYYYYYYYYYYYCILICLILELFFAATLWLCMCAFFSISLFMLALELALSC